ncbi:MAG: GntR family transcriptional regulator [Firmicutes bacterium]|nr:GntR family transcriptional regulator [Bacillota bacterium]
MILQIDTHSAQPLYEQLRDQVVFGIADGRLAAGEALPSVRRLAADLGINFHTVSKAYAALAEEGYIAVDRRRGAAVRAATGGDVPKFVGQLTLCAAQALCRGMAEEDFIELCRGCYRQAQEGGASCKK